MSGRGGGGGFNVLSSVVNTAASLQKARAKERAARANAAALERQAQETRELGERRLDLNKREGEIFIGDQVSRFARAGVEISGSPLLVLADTQNQIDRDSADIQVQTNREVAELQTEAGQQRAEARARRASRTGILLGGFLGGAAQAFNDSGGS